MDHQYVPLYAMWQGWLAYLYEPPGLTYSSRGILPKVIFFFLRRCSRTLVQIPKGNLYLLPREWWKTQCSKPFQYTDERKKGRRGMSREDFCIINKYWKCSSNCYTEKCLRTDGKCLKYDISATAIQRALELHSGRVHSTHVWDHKLAVIIPLSCAH